MSWNNRSRFSRAHNTRRYMLGLASLNSVNEFVISKRAKLDADRFDNLMTMLFQVVNLLDDCKAIMNDPLAGVVTSNADAGVSKVWFSLSVKFDAADNIIAQVTKEVLVFAKDDNDESEKTHE